MAAAHDPFDVSHEVSSRLMTLIEYQHFKMQPENGGWSAEQAKAHFEKMLARLENADIEDCAGGTARLWVKTGDKYVHKPAKSKTKLKVKKKEPVVSVMEPADMASAEQKSDNEPTDTASAEAMSDMASADESSGSEPACGDIVKDPIRLCLACNDETAPRSKWCGKHNRATAAMRRQSKGNDLWAREFKEVFGGKWRSSNGQLVTFKGMLLLQIKWVKRFCEDYPVVVGQKKQRALLMRRMMPRMAF